ncbi:flavin-containing monooxygenase [Flindersiella endophytica]
MTDPRGSTGVVIIGAGFSGLGMAIQLLKAGRTDFVLLEKADDVGGTWRENTYPGCGCDIPSSVYSFSHDLNPAWTRTYPGQQEIWDYLRRLTESYDLREYIRFGVEVTSARWDADANEWEVASASGDTYRGHALVNGFGLLHVPRIPELPGLERFEGEAFHSAQWNHDVDLRGKRVAVIGTGASAIQFVPKIAPEVGELYIFQRTPGWLIPKPDRPLPDWMKRLFARVPLAQQVYRKVVWLRLEAQAPAFNGNATMQKVAERISLKHLHDQIEDPELRRKLTPSYRTGCKRVMPSNDYFPVFNRENVELVDRAAVEVTERGVVDREGVEREVDVIILATGFEVMERLGDLKISGRDGADLADTFDSHGLTTYLGINVSGFPNLFFLLGPNTGLGHNTVVFMIEQQIKYVMRCLRLLDRTHAAALDVRPEAQQAFNADIQRKLGKGIWTRGGCASWYLDAAGVNRAIWPGYSGTYWFATRRVRRNDYELIGSSVQD